MTAVGENRKFWTNPVVVVLAAVLLYFGSQLLAVLLTAPFTSFVSNENALQLLILGSSFLVFIAILRWGMQLIGFGWHTIGVAKTRLHNLLLVPIAFIVYLTISQTFTWLATHFSWFKVDQPQELGLNTSGATNLAFAFIVLVILAPLFEELLFRGVLFHGLRSRLPLLLSVLVSSIIFAGAHGQLNVAIDTFALGIILCLLTARTKSLLPAVLLHALKNLLAFGVLYLGWFS